MPVCGIWAFKHYRKYLLGTLTYLMTDCSSLVPLLTSKSLTNQIPEGQIFRWMLSIQQYTFEIVYIPGKEMPADALSRAPIAHGPPTEEGEGVDEYDPVTFAVLSEYVADFDESAPAVEFNVVTTRAAEKHLYDILEEVDPTLNEVEDTGLEEEHHEDSATPEVEGDSPAQNLDSTPGEPDSATPREDVSSETSMPSELPSTPTGTDESSASQVENRDDATSSPEASGSVPNTTAKEPEPNFTAVRPLDTSEQDPVPGDTFPDTPVVHQPTVPPPIRRRRKVVIPEALPKKAVKISQEGLREILDFPLPWKHEELREAQRLDVMLGPMILYKDAEVENPQWSTMVKNWIAKTHEQYYVKNQLLYHWIEQKQPGGQVKYQFQVCIPHPFRLPLMEMFHSTAWGAHQPFDTMVQKMQLKYYWPTMMADTRHFVESCTPCAIYKKGENLRIPLKPIRAVSPFLHDCHGYFDSES